MYNKIEKKRCDILINCIYVYNFYLVQLGAAHGDDLTYEFYSDALKNVPQPDSPAQKMVRIYTTLLANFAKDGYVHNSSQKERFC